MCFPYIIYWSNYYCCLLNSMNSYQPSRTAGCLSAVDRWCVWNTRRGYWVIYQMECTDAQFVQNALVDVNCWSGLDLKDCCGQGYNGAATMSGRYIGVAKHITDIELRALYTHTVLLTTCHIFADLVSGIFYWFQNVCENGENADRCTSLL